MVNDTGMSIGLLIMITVFIPVMTRKNLFYGLSPCLYDVYINLSMYGTGPVLVPFVLFYILYVERHNFSAVSAITSVYKFYIYIAVFQRVFYYGTYYDGFMVDIR